MERCRNLWKDVHLLIQKIHLDRMNRIDRMTPRIQDTWSDQKKCTGICFYPVNPVHPVQKISSVLDLQFRKNI